MRIKLLRILQEKKKKGRGRRCLHVIGISGIQLSQAGQSTVSLQPPRGAIDSHLIFIVARALPHDYRGHRFISPSNFMVLGREHYPETRLSTHSPNNGTSTTTSFEALSLHILTCLDIRLTIYEEQAWLSHRRFRRKRSLLLVTIRIALL